MNPPKGSGDKRDFKTFLLGPDEPIYNEAGIGSALKGIIKMATRSKYPKFAPKKASLEDKIKYREARAKDLKKIRDKKSAKAEAKKDKRLTKYRKKRDAAASRAAARVKKREDRERGKQAIRDYEAEIQAEIARTRQMAARSAAQRDKARSQREAAGRAADAAQANRARLKRVGGSGRKGTNATGSEIGGAMGKRHRDQFGNWGWR